MLASPKYKQHFLSTQTEAYNSIFKRDSGEEHVMVTTISNTRFLIKTCETENGKAPASELFCHMLFAQLGIPTPRFSIIQVKDGSLVFGSEFIQNAQDLQSDAKLPIFLGQIKIDGANNFFSTLYAADLFINNEDRHPNNYIHSDEHSNVIYAIDFGRAWYATPDPLGPYGYTALGNCPTQMYHEELIRNGLYDASIAEQTLNTIAALPQELIGEFLACLPRDWLPEDEKEKFKAWWGSDEMKTRIDKLKTHIRSENINT